MLFVNSIELIILIVVCAIAATCFISAVALLIWNVNNQRRKQKPARELTGISVDANATKHEFAFGEEFTCDGLIVNAEYNLAPTTQPLDFKVVTADEFMRLIEAGATSECYVIKPDASKAGEDIVIIKYMDKATCYAITVFEPIQEPVQEPEQEPVQEETPQQESAQEEDPQTEPAQESAPEDQIQEETVQEEPEQEQPEQAEEEFEVEEPATEELADEQPTDEEPEEEQIVQNIFDDESPEEEPEEEPEDEPEEEEIIVRKREPIVNEEDEEESYQGVRRYNKSFTAKYIQSSDVVKNWYVKLKNELLSYKKVKTRMSWKRETFRMGRNVVARLGFRGNTLCIYFPLDPAAYVESKYKVEDVSDQVTYADTPCMYRLKNQRRVRYAIELFATVMENMGGMRIERVSEDYYLPYEGIVELIEKGLAKRVVRSKADEHIFLQTPVAEAAATIVSDDKAPIEDVAEDAVEAPAKEQPVIEETRDNAEEQAVIEEVPIEEERPQQLPEEETQGHDLPVEEETSEEAENCPQKQEETAGEYVEAMQTDAALIEDPAEEAEEQPVEGQVEEPVAQTQFAEAEDNSNDASEEMCVEDVEEQEAPEDETAEAEGEVDFSSGLSSEKPRLNGKNRKKHRVHK